MQNKRLSICFSFILFTIQLFSQQLSGNFKNTVDDSLFREISIRLINLKIDKAEDIPLAFIQVPDIERNTDSLEKLLPLNYLYPVDDSLFKFRTIQDLRKRVLDLKLTVGKKMDRIELVLHNEGLERLGLADTIQAKKLFNLSTSYKPDYSPSWYQLVKISITPSTIQEAETYLNEALRKIDTSSNPYYASLWKQCESEVFNGFLLAANRKVQSDDYFTAISLVDKAFFFCKSHHVNNCNDSLKRYYQLAKGGMFQSYIKIAKRAIENNKPELANEYINKGKTYYQDNITDISCGYLLDETTTYLNQKLVQNEISKENKSHNISRKTVKINNPKIKTNRIRHFIKPQIPSTQVYVKKSIPKPIIDTTVIHFASVEVKDSVLMSIRQAYFLVWKNELDSAKSICAFFRKTLPSVYLENDYDVNAAMEELTNRIENQECFNIKSTYGNFLNQAINQYNRDMFIESEEYLNQAIELYWNTNLCELDDSLLKQLKNKYIPVYQFNSMKRQVNQNLLNGNFDEFLKGYSELDNYIKKNNVSGDKFVLTDFETLITQINKVELTKKAIELSINLQDKDRALALLDILRKQGVPSKLCRNEQLGAAQLLANSDHLSEFADSEQAEKQYLIDKKWYMFFRNAYTKELKQLNSIK